MLKPGGRAVVVDLLRHDREQFRIEMGQTSRGFSRDELHDLLAESGLQQVSCRPLAPEADAKGPALLLATAVTPNQALDAAAPIQAQSKSQPHKAIKPKGKS